MANNNIRGQYHGQVEPNRLSGQKGGMLPAQYPYTESATTLDNGHFCVLTPNSSTGAIEVKNATNADKNAMLVFNEVKVYDERETAKDFCLDKGKSIDGKIYPRLIPVAVGDEFTTTYAEDNNGTALEVNDYLKIEAGVPTYVASASKGSVTGILLQVVSKETNYPGINYVVGDTGNYAVKVLRVQ